MRKLRVSMLIIIALIIMLIIASCGGKKPTSQYESPVWWQALSMQEREYFAELYRVSIAIAVMEETQLHFIQQWRMRQTQKDASYDTTAWRAVLEYRRIASDRTRLALRLADGESAKWLKQFLSLYLEANPIHVTNSERFLQELDSLANISIDPIPTRFSILYEPGRTVAIKLTSSVPSIVLWEIRVSPNASLTEHATGFGSQVQPEPKEERTPMGKLLAANWITQPEITAQEQIVRWKRMVETEFDDPLWKLGGTSRGMATQP